MLTFLWTGLIITLISASNLVIGCWLAFLIYSKDPRRATEALRYWITNPFCKLTEVRIILGFAEQESLDHSG